MTSTAVPLVDLKMQYREIKVEIDAAIQRVVDCTGFINGPEVTGFEAEYAAAIGAEHCVGVASGTAALMLALAACEVGAGDEVIVPTHTFAATAEAVCHVGAKPVFVDIEADGFCMDPAGLEHAIGPRTKAVIPVHLYGHAANMGPILEIARRHGLFVIEDAAQAHLGRYEDQACGTLGDLACFSFFPGKNLGAYGDAGGVTGNNGDLIAKVRCLRDHGRSSKYTHEIVGYGERMDALQAAILRTKLPHLSRWTEQRNVLAQAYQTRLRGLPVVLPQTRQNVYHAYHLFVIETDHRDALQKALQTKGVGAGIHYPIPLHRQPAFQPTDGSLGSMPRTERVVSRILSLPLFPEMTMEQLTYVVDSLEEGLAAC